MRSLVIFEKKSVDHNHYGTRMTCSIFKQLSLTLCERDDINNDHLGNHKLLHLKADNNGQLNSAIVSVALAVLLEQASVHNDYCY